MAGLGVGPEFFVVGDRRENGRSQSWKFWWSIRKGLPNTEVTAGGRGGSTRGLRKSVCSCRPSCPRVALGGPRVDSCGCGVGMCTTGGMFPDVLPEVWPLPALHAHSPWNALLVARCVYPPTFGPDAVSPSAIGSSGPTQAPQPANQPGHSRHVPRTSHSQLDP